MRSKTKTILRSGLVAGTFDVTAAIVVYAVILQKTTGIKILQSIASAIFKKDAYDGGLPMAFCGLVFHYLIALSFAWFYFIIYPYLPFLKKNAIISGFLYGIFVWVIMNLIVLPIAFPVLPEKHLDFPLFLSMLILMFCIGLPIAFITRNYYANPK
ncbi:DUF1440 domain-containing protein [Flavobacterium chilense]|uniref:DUF1440 domain-containing protein n=1 Tax=Flavobacterium chilense TaxID=946677 RepID=A0A1M7FD56_9FLAO|nr:DUF1440 domain-containing protein [Flavobacterium chilense]SHM01639.1 hypothetical protein SAMN05444484_103319 [Flavobacterium chilense]